MATKTIFSNHNLSPELYVKIPNIPIIVNYIGGKDRLLVVLSVIHLNLLKPDFFIWGWGIKFNVFTVVLC